jgi:hypothetical protein
MFVRDLVWETGMSFNSYLGSTFCVTFCACGEQLPFQTCLPLGVVNDAVTNWPRIRLLLMYSCIGSVLALFIDQQIFVSDTPSPS